MSFFKRALKGFATGGLSEWGKDGIFRKGINEAKGLLGFDGQTSLPSLQGVGNLVGPKWGAAGGIADALIGPGQEKQKNFR